MSQRATLIEFQTVRGEPYVFTRSCPATPVRFLSLCFDHYFCLAQISQALGISSTTLRKAFIEYAGISPKAWMTQQRVMLSVRLIREGKTLSEVAERMIYSDYRHMAKEFRSVVEYTPKSMMKLLKNLQSAKRDPVSAL